MGSCIIFSRSPPAFWGIDDSDDPLGSGIYMDVPNFDCLAVARSMSIKRLDHVELQSQQLGRATAVHVDVDLIHVNLALAQVPLLTRIGLALNRRAPVAIRIYAVFIDLCEVGSKKLHVK